MPLAPFPAARRDRRSTAGFTLIEVLVALIVFAVMAAMGYRGLSAVLDARGQLAAEAKRWRELTLFFLYVENDLSATVNRPARDTYGQLQAALVGRSDPTGDIDGQLSFTRLGTPGTGNASAAIQRVTYRWRNNTVELLSWPAPDLAPRATPKVYPMLKDVTDFKLSYLDGTNHQWQTAWQPVAASSVLPVAVKLELTLASGLHFDRVFSLPAAL
jgi:general secretion pathway protein J